VKKDKKKSRGDVIGLSDAPASPKLPHPPSDGSTPRGIELDEYTRHTGTDDLKPSKGATGIDMGAGGSGTDVSSERPAPKSGEKI
jgi:hypothetical protein